MFAKWKAKLKEAIKTKDKRKDKQKKQQGVSAGAVAEQPVTTLVEKQSDGLSRPRECAAIAMYRRFHKTPRAVPGGLGVASAHPYLHIPAAAALCCCRWSGGSEVPGCATKPPSGR